MQRRMVILRRRFGTEEGNLNYIYVQCVAWR